MRHSLSCVNYPSERYGGNTDAICTFIFRSGLHCYAVLPTPTNPAYRRLSDREVGTYLTYRCKLNELIHLNYLFLHMKNTGCGEQIVKVPVAQVMETVRTAALAWFSTLADRSGLNIFDLWLRMFPRYQRRITIFRTAIQSQLDKIREFRNNTAFHANPVFAEFFAPRVVVMDDREEIVAALQKFLKLAVFLLRREHWADPELHARMLDVILDAELQKNCRIRRAFFIEAHILEREAVFGTRHF